MDFGVPGVALGISKKAWGFRGARVNPRDFSRIPCDPRMQKLLFYYMKSMVGIRVDFGVPGVALGISKKLGDLGEQK